MSPRVGMGRQRIKLNPAACRVRCGLESMFDVEIAVPVVAIGADKNHTFFRQLIDEHVAEGSAIWGAPLWKAPAVVDDQTFVVRLCHILHPGEGIQRGGFVHHQGGKQQFGGRGHACQSHACSAPRSNACDMGPMGGVAIDVGGVTAHQLDFPWRFSDGAVAKRAWRGSCLTVLVPNASDARLGEGGVVKHGVGAIKSPVQNPDQYAFPMVGLRKVQACVDAVHPGTVAGFVQIRHSTRGQFN